MDRLLLDAHVTEGELAVLSSRLVVVAGDIDHVGALARLAQDLLDHVIVRLRPVPPALKPPAVDDVAYEVEIFAFVLLQEVEQKFGLAAAGAEMNVGQKDCAVTGGLMALDHCHRGTVMWITTPPTQNLSCAIARTSADCVCEPLRARESHVTVR